MERPSHNDKSLVDQNLRKGRTSVERFSILGDLSAPFSTALETLIVRSFEIIQTHVPMDSPERQTDIILLYTSNPTSST